MEATTKPVRAADLSRPEKCVECGHRVGYSDFTATKKDGQWVLRHVLPGYTDSGRSCREAY